MPESNEFQLKCPGCGNDGRTRDRDKQIAFVVWVAVYTHVLAQDKSTVYIDHAKQGRGFGHDETKAEKLHCGKCDRMWAIPEGLVLDDLEMFTGKTYGDLEE